MIQKNMIVYSKRYRLFRVLAWITVLQIVNLITNIGIAITLSGIIAGLFSGQLDSVHVGLLAVAFTLLLIKGVCHYFATKLTHYTSHELKSKMRRELLEKLLSLSPQAITKLQISKISQLSVEGIENIDVYYSRYLPQLFYSLIAPVILFITLSFIHWQIALFLLLAMILIPVCIVGAVKVGKKIFHTYWNKYLNVGKKFVEGVQGLHMLKMYGGDQAYQDLMHEESEDFRIMTMKVLRMQLQSITIMDLVSYLGTAAGIVFSAVAYGNGTISLFGFVCFALLTVEFFVPMRLLGSYFHVGLNGMSALKRLTEIMEADDEGQTSQSLHTNATGDIGFNEVGYHYSEKESNFELKPCSFVIKQGQFIGIAGASGSGKSTVSHLMQQFLRPSTGDITIGTIPLSKLHSKAIHQYMGSVSNQSHLFDGSILSNLRLGNAAVTEEQAQRMLQYVKLHEFSSHLDAHVASEGANLSSGQRQKLAIARLLLKQTDVLIFDEATANIDQQSERDIFEIIRNLHAGGKTIIVITHRLLNIQHADSILIFNQGNLIETGNHVQLMEQEGVYAQLYIEQQAFEMEVA